jgi:hypothetical protein
VAEGIDRRIAELAKRRRGYVTRRQLLALGESRYEIEYRIKAGRLIPVYSGVYAVGHLPTLPQDRAVGALLACGDGAVLSHGSASSLWGVFRYWRMPFEVTTTTARRPKGIHVHRALLQRADIKYQAGIRVTSAARTMLDVAPRMTDKALRRAVNDLRRPGHLRVDALADVLERFPRAPGAARLRAFLDRPTGPTRSELEDAFLALAERYGLPRPQINVHVAGREADAWFPEERVIVEIDGWDFHSDRGSFEGDRDKDTTALEHDIVTVRLTDRRMTGSPRREAERLLRILDVRRRRRAA